MNYKVVFSTLGKTMVIVASLMFLPIVVALIYKEQFLNILSFLVPMAGLLAIGLPLSFLKSKDKTVYAKEGFVIVVLVWLIISLTGALPFVISGRIPNYIDAVFETVSGFTTTGSSVVSDTIESWWLNGGGYHSLVFWRSFTHFIGGMGVLVFVLMILPSSDGLIHLFKTESPGPIVGKLVGKLKFTARILYGIYIVLTLILVLMLNLGGMPFFDSLCYAFGTAGTGGLAIHNNCMLYYNNAYFEIVIAVFMFIFSVNFNVYYLLLIGQFKKSAKCEELRVYFILIVTATLAIALNIFFAGVHGVATFWDALRHAFFQVTTISSTTGYYSMNFDVWPSFSKAIILLLMIIGACAGSTGGGMKVSRFTMLAKSSACDIKKMVKPRAVVTPKFEGQPLTAEQTSNVKTYFFLYVLIAIVSVLILSLDKFGTGDTGQFSAMETHISATITCLSNVGPGFSAVGPVYSFAGYSALSKIVLSLDMLIGRLEIFPLIIFVIPSAWKRK